MTGVTESFDLIQRRCGGWLAVSAEANPIQIGVAADTAAEATEEFRRTETRWAELLASEEASVDCR